MRINLFIKLAGNRKLEKIYDVLTFLEAAKEICKKRDDIYFYIAGNGSLKNIFIKFVIDNNLGKHQIPWFT